MNIYCYIVNYLSQVVAKGASLVFEVKIAGEPTDVKVRVLIEFHKVLIFESAL